MSASCSFLLYPSVGPWLGKKRSRALLLTTSITLLVTLSICVQTTIVNVSPVRRVNPERNTISGVSVEDEQELRAAFGNLESMLKGNWGRVRGLCDRVIETADWPICGDQLINVSGDDLVVYGFGIADDYDFEAACGLRGMDVYAFDPTRNYPSQLSPNVTFFNFAEGRASGTPRRGSAPPPSAEDR